MTGIIAKLAQWVIDVIHALGYVGVALLVALENLFPPIPSELILPLSGFLVGRGRFSFVLVLMAATLGAVLGAAILYGLARWLGERRLRKFVKRVGRYALIGQADIDRSRDWFCQHGGAAVFLGRMVPGVRSLISVPAGLEAMPFWRFAAYTTLGSGIWNAVLIALGWILGDQWRLVQQYATYLEYAVLAVLGLAVAWFLWRRFTAYSKQRT